MPIVKCSSASNTGGQCSHSDQNKSQNEWQSCSRQIEELTQRDIGVEGGHIGGLTTVRKRMDQDESYNNNVHDGCEKEPCSTSAFFGCRESSSSRLYIILICDNLADSTMKLSMLAKG